MRNLQVNIGLNASAFTAGAQQVASGFGLIGNAASKVSSTMGAATLSFQKNAQAMLVAKTNAKGLTEGYRELRASGERITQMGRGLTLGLSAPLLLAGGAALKTAVDMEALKISLGAVTGSTAEAEKQFKQLIQVAKVPGITLKGAVETSITLQSIGYDAKFAEETIRALGNAMALMGKSEDDLKGVVLAMSQIKGKGKAEYEEINQIAERLPQIRDIIKKTWGLNSDELTKAKIPVDEFLEGIKNGIAAMPKFAGSAKNDLMNLSDVIQQLGDAVGKGLLPPLRAGIGILMPMLEGIGNVLNQLPPSIKNVGLALTGIGIIIGPLVMLMGSFSSSMAAARQGLAELSALKTRFAAAAGSATTATTANTAATTTNTGANTTNTGATGANAGAKKAQAAAVAQATTAVGANTAAQVASMRTLAAAPGGLSAAGRSGFVVPTGGNQGVSPNNPYRMFGTYPNSPAALNTAAQAGGGGFLTTALAYLMGKGGTNAPFFDPNRTIQGPPPPTRFVKMQSGLQKFLYGGKVAHPLGVAALAALGLGMDMYAQGQPESRQEDADIFGMKVAGGATTGALVGGLLGGLLGPVGATVGIAGGAAIGGWMTSEGLKSEMEAKYKAQADAANQHSEALKEQTIYLKRVQEISEARIAGIKFDDEVMRLEAKFVGDKVKLAEKLGPVYDDHIANLRDYISKIEKHVGPNQAEKQLQIAEVESEIAKKELEISKINHAAHKQRKEKIAKAEREKEKAWVAQLGLIETVAEAQSELAPKGFEKRAAAQILVPALMKQQGIINKKLQETKRGSEDFFLLQNDFFKIQTRILQIRKLAVEEANKKNSKTAEEMQELVQASHDAAEARIQSEIAGSPEHLKETTTSIKMIPFLMAKKDILLNQLRSYNQSQKEFWAISKDVWDIQSNIVGLSQSSVAEAKKNEETRLEKVKKEHSDSMELLTLKGQRLDEQMRGAGLTEEQQAIRKIPYLMQVFKKLSAPVQGETAVEKEQREINALKTRNDITQSLFQRNKPQGKVALGGGIIPMFKPESAFPGQGYSGMFKPDVYVFQNQFNIANDAEFEKRVVDVLSRFRQLSGNFRRRN